MDIHRAATCAHCGEGVVFNPRAVGRISQKFHRPLTGWSHDDPAAGYAIDPKTNKPFPGGRFDHEAAPHDGRSPEAEMARADQVKAGHRDKVNRVLGGQFALLETERIMNKAGEAAGLHLPKPR